MSRLRRSSLGVVLVCLAGLIVLGCTKEVIPPPAGPEWFEDVTKAVGLDFVHDPGPLDGSYFMPQIVGSGAALFDLDDDGRLDIYLIHNGGPGGKKNQLFRQKADRTFEDISAGSGLDVAGYGMGGARRLFGEPVHDTSHKSLFGPASSLRGVSPTILAMKSWLTA